MTEDLELGAVISFGVLVEFCPGVLVLLLFT